MVVHGGVRDECMRAVLEKEHKIILDKQLVVLKLFCPENTLESTMPPHHTDEHPFLTLLFFFGQPPVGTRPWPGLYY